MTAPTDVTVLVAGPTEAPEHKADPAPSTLVALRGGLATQIDLADVATFGAWDWSPLPRKDGRGWYAVRWQAGWPRTIYLHRELLGAPPDAYVDHVNDDGLDNRRENLRLCTPSESAAKRASRGTQTGYRGVYQHYRRFYAQITVAGRTRTVGRFATAEEAAVAYDHAATLAFGPFARLNFPEGERS